VDPAAARTASAERFPRGGASDCLLLSLLVGLATRSRQAPHPLVLAIGNGARQQGLEAGQVGTPQIRCLGARPWRRVLIRQGRERLSYVVRCGEGEHDITDVVAGCQLLGTGEGLVDGWRRRWFGLEVIAFHVVKFNPSPAGDLALTRSQDGVEHGTVLLEDPLGHVAEVAVQDAPAVVRRRGDRDGVWVVVVVRASNERDMHRNPCVTPPPLRFGPDRAIRQVPQDERAQASQPVGVHTDLVRFRGISGRRG